MASLSLGFADEQQFPDIQPVGTPSDGLPPEAPGLGLADATAGIGDMSALPIGRAAPQSRSLGLEPRVSARPQSDQDYLRSLSAGEKIGLMMQEFSAGVSGRASPIDNLLKQKREKELHGMQTLTNTLTLMKTGTEMVRKFPVGSLQRNSMLAELGKVAPHLAPFFAAAGSQDDEINNTLDVLFEPKVKQMVVKFCSGRDDQQACYVEFAKNHELSDKASARVDAERIPGILDKMRAFSDSMKAKSKTGDGSFSLADIESMNKGNAIFTPEEMFTIRRKNSKQEYSNEKVFANFGLKTSAVQQAGDIAREQARVKDENLTEKYDTGKTAHLPGKLGTFPARVSKIGATAGTIEIQGADGQWTANPAARLISQPGVDKPPKPDREKAGEYTLKDGSTINHSQLVQQYKLENNLMDELDLRILDKTDPVRGAREREKIRNAMPFPQWTKQNFNVDVRGGSAAAAVPTPAPKPSDAKTLPSEIVSKLKQGTNSTLSDGSVWTLENGKPKRVR